MHAHRAPRDACDAADTDGRQRVEVERDGVSASIDVVHAAAILRVGGGHVPGRDAVCAALVDEHATLEHGGCRVEVDLVSKRQ